MWDIDGTPSTLLRSSSATSTRLSTTASSGYPHHIGDTRPILFGNCIGMTENMVVQDAAYSCMDLLREEHAMLRETSFRYIPATLPGEEGYYTGLYSDHSAEDPVLQMTARFSCDRDRDAHT